MGNITEWSGYGYVAATMKTQDRNYWRQLFTSDPAMDGEYDRVVRVGLRGGNKEDTGGLFQFATIMSRANHWYQAEILSLMRRSRSATT